MLSGVGLSYFLIAAAAALLFCGVLVVAGFRWRVKQHRKPFASPALRRTTALSGDGKGARNMENPLLQLRRKPQPKKTQRKPLTVVSQTEEEVRPRRGSVSEGGEEKEKESRIEEGEVVRPSELDSDSPEPPEPSEAPPLPSDDALSKKQAAAKKLDIKEWGALRRAVIAHPKLKTLLTGSEGKLSLPKGWVRKEDGSYVREADGAHFLSLHLVLDEILESL